MLTTTSSLGDEELAQEWVDPPSDEINVLPSNNGTIAYNPKATVERKWTKLNDLFEVEPSSSRLSDLFANPASRNVEEGVKPRDLFEAQKYNTITRDKMKGIMAALDESQPTVFAWPMGTKSSADDSTPSTTIGKNGKEATEYPNHIDFLDDDGETGQELEQEVEVEALNLNCGSEYPIEMEQNRRPVSKPRRTTEDFDRIDEIPTSEFASNIHDRYSLMSSEKSKLSIIHDDASLRDHPSLTETPKAKEIRGSGENVYYSKQSVATTPSKGCLDLSYRQLKFIGESMMLGLDYTRYKLNHNQLEYLSEVAGTAQILYVTNNLLSDMTSFSHLTSLCTLDISYNQLTDLSGKLLLLRLAISVLYSLKELKASDNNINDLLPILTLQNLTHLNLNNNRLESLDFGPSSLPRIHTLSLSGNKITTVTNLFHLKYLQELLLDENSISNIVIQRIMKRLQILNLNDNLLEQFDGSNIPVLNSLHLDRNRISKITGLQAQLSILSLESQDSTFMLFEQDRPLSCVEIRVGGNHHIQWRKDLFSGVEVFDASDCQLMQIPSCITQSMQIRNLNLENNQITNLEHLSLLKNLRVLLLAHNHLSDIYATTKVLSQLPLLTILDVRHNRFVSETANASQAEVGAIIEKTCFLLECQQLKTFNQEVISHSDRKKAAHCMKSLKRNASSHAQKKTYDVFQDWQPELQALTFDMTAGEDLVLEFL